MSKEVLKSFSQKLKIFSDNGTVYPATVIEAGPCSITQIKTIKKDGYSAVQIGYADMKESNANKPSLGHFNKSKSSPKKYLKNTHSWQRRNIMPKMSFTNFWHLTVEF